jgi:hypothetical protein
MTSSKIYLPEHRTMQDKFGTRVLADKQEELIALRHYSISLSYNVTTRP